MKLHLPSNLLRAVMAIFVAHVAFATGKAEAATFYVNEDVTYGNNGLPWAEDTAHIPGSSITVTSDADKQYSATYDGTNGAVVGPIVVSNGWDLNKLGSLTVKNVEAYADSDTRRGGVVNSDDDISITNNGDITFVDNTLHADLPDFNALGVRGGAIAANGDMTIGGEPENGNGNISFCGNKVINDDDASTEGGAISLYSGDPFSDGNIQSGLNISYNDSVTFAGNVASNTGYGSSANGGAIHVSGTYSDVIISNNSGTVTFSDNVATSGEMGATGGAIGTSSKVDYKGAVALYSNEGGVVFDGNQVRATTNWTMGAAIATGHDIVIIDNGYVTINNNTCINYNNPLESSVEGGGLNIGGALSTGAIGYGDVYISYNKGDVNVTSNGVAVQDGNLAVAGAIYGYGVSIVGNAGDVTFAGNFESCAAGSQYAEIFGNGGTMLRSIVVGTGMFELAAEEGKSITFYDSICVAANDEMVVFNGYGDAMNGGNVKVSTGDIIFSGARTEQDLATVQEYLESQNITAPESNVQGSRTSVISRDIMLAAGSLQVKDGAVLRVGAMDGTEGNMLYLIDGQREAGSFGVTYPEGHMPELVVSAGSRIEAGSILFDSNTEFTVVGNTPSVEDAVTFNLNEAAPVAELQVDTVTMTGGMTYSQDGAYTMLVGDANELVIDVTNGLAFTINLDDSIAYTEGEKTYFVLFTDIETLSLNGATGWDEVGITFNADGYEDFALGYLEDSGKLTLYVSAKSIVSPNIPEPTTATLSLLALAALSARRRRK